MKYNSILLVEDGSIDVDEVKKELNGQKVLLITYRQGAVRPELVYLEPPQEQGLPACGFQIEDESDYEEEW